MKAGKAGNVTLVKQDKVWTLNINGIKSHSSNMKVLLKLLKLLELADSLGLVQLDKISLGGIKKLEASIAKK